MMICCNGRRYILFSNLLLLSSLLRYLGQLLWNRSRFLDWTSRWFLSWWWNSFYRIFYKRHWTINIWLLSFVVLRSIKLFVQLFNFLFNPNFFFIFTSKSIDFLLFLFLGLFSDLFYKSLFVLFLLLLLDIQISFAPKLESFEYVRSRFSFV